MRVSLSVSAREGTCSKCGAGPILIIPFVVITENATGEAEGLCQGCLFDQDGLRVDIPMQELDRGPLNRRKTLRKAKKTSQKQEQDIAEELGGRTQPGSGSQRGAKGDVRKKGELRVEAKFTTAESFSLKLDELYKIAGECGAGEKAVLVIDYLDPGTRRPKDRFAVVHFQDLKELLHAASQHR